MEVKIPNPALDLVNAAKLAAAPAPTANPVILGTANSFATSADPGGDVNTPGKQIPSNSVPNLS